LVTVGDVGTRGAIVAGHDAGKAIDFCQTAPTGRHLVEHTAQRVNVGTLMDGLGAVAAPWR